MFRLTDPLFLFPFALAARAIGRIARPADRATVGRVLLDSVFITYVVSLLKVVLGFRRLGGLGEDFQPWAHVSLIPFGTIGGLTRAGLAAGAVGQIVGNILLFVPLGMLLPLTSPRFSTFRPVVMAGVTLSAIIELTQLGLLLGGLMNRAADIDDLLLNTIGTVLGYAVWSLGLRGSGHQAADRSMGHAN